MTQRHLTARLLSVFALCAASLGFAQNLHSQTVYALSGNTLISFSATAPGTLLGSATISGITAGQEVVGLDFRPNTGELYALGYSQSSGAARLYTLHLGTGAATPVGAAAITLQANMGKVSMDFNPTVDRIRVTGSNNANYRLHPATGALAATDLSLGFAAADPNAATNPSVGTVGYTNSYIGATSTTLYNYDDSLNVLTTQIPPNNGTLNTVGTSGITMNLSDPSSDMDIWFDAAAGLNRAYLAANTGADANDNLYSLNLMTGAATLIGKIGTGIAVSDIAVLIDRTVPAKVTGRTAYALTTNNNLISFDTDLPGTVRRLVGVTGLATGQTLVGTDFRPATGELFGLGYNSATGEARLYTLDVNTGAATAVGMAPIALRTGMDKVSMDFNPTVDRIRVTGSDNSNYRLHPVTGALAATDMDLAFAAADKNAGINPSVGAGAYTNSFGGTTTTTLYNYEDSLNVLTTQIPPNNGTLNTVGISGLTVNLADQTTDMDIVYNHFSGANTAYLAANVGTSTFDNLYTLSLTTGAATLVGRIGNGIAVSDLALTLDPVPSSCEVRSVNCVRYELLSITRNAAGDKTYRIRFTNSCADPLIYVAFQIPSGVTAVGPASGTAYTSLGGRAYEVRNPNFSPFYSVRFRPMGTGIANGMMDAFEYTLPATANPNFIQVTARTGSTTHDSYLNVFACTVNSTLSPGNGNSAAANREGNEEDATLGANAATEFRLFPNPTQGLLFTDLTAWAGQQVQIRAFNAQGQQVADLSATGGEPQAALDLLTNLPDGLYFVEMNATDGSRATQRVMLRK
jgi:hypothetical protein